MFKLYLKNEAKVSTLEELRDNFDLEIVLDYFKSGNLLKWLEDRFYEDEADAISAIDANDKNLTVKICAALGLECDDNLEFMLRVREKKALLAEKTNDETIIDKADRTALNQEDLAILIQMNYKTIYLCGENFNVPIRIEGIKYIGILGTPKIKIRAKSQEELDEKNISFDNVQLPWQKAAPIEELKALAEKIFQTGGKFPVVKSGNQVSTFDQLGKDEKSAALRMVCQGKYEEHQIAFMQITEDLSSGFAMTIDSFCTGGGVGANSIPYKEINRATRYKTNRWSTEKGLSVKFRGGALYLNGEFDSPPNFIDSSDKVYNIQACKKLFTASDYEKIKDFLEVAKNF